MSLYCLLLAALLGLVSCGPDVTNARNPEPASASAEQIVVPTSRPTVVGIVERVTTNEAFDGSPQWLVRVLLEDVGDEAVLSMGDFVFVVDSTSVLLLRSGKRIPPADLERGMRVSGWSSAWIQTQVGGADTLVVELDMESSRE
jgi:hypothetical protein